MRSLVLRIALTVSLGILFLSGALGVFTWPDGAPVAQAQGGTGTVRVAPSGSDGLGCGAASTPCQTIQYAINQAGGGDEIWIATLEVSGSLVSRTTTTRYTGDGANVIELTRSLTLRGGYVYYHVSTLTGTVTRWQPGLIPALVDGEDARRGLYIKGDGITPTVQYLAFVRGTADRGGNVYVEDASPILRVTPVLSGNANYGGGLYLKNSRLSIDPGNISAQTLLNVSGFLPIQNNSAQYDGGGVYVEGGAPALSLLYVYSNTAANGGGVYAAGGRPIIAGGVVKENRAGNQGGAFYLNESAARVAALAVYSNTAAGNGAGFYLDGPFNFSAETAPIIANNYIRYNNAGSNLGGGFYFSEAIAGLVNNVIAENNADQGAGMYLYASSPQVFHNTIAQNTGSSGVYLTHKPGQIWPPIIPVPSYPSFTNTIIVTHSVGVYVDSTGLPAPLQNKATLDGSLWWGNTSNTAGAGEIVHAHDVYSSPQFLCTGNLPNCLRPYHLITDSNAVDAGVEVALTLPGADLFWDIDGQLRPSGKGYDIGADEVVSRSFSVWLIPSLSTLPAAPDQTVTHTHRLLNTGLQTDTYDLSGNSSPGWGTLLGNTVITLSAQSSQTVQVLVVVPLSATNQQSDTTVISVTSRADPNNRAGALDVTRVVTAEQADLSLGLAAQPIALPPGGMVQYSYSITNNGPYSGTIPATLTVQLVPAAALESWDLSANCTGNIAGGYVTCTVTLAAETPPVLQSLTMQVTASNVYSGQLINMASIQGNLADPVPGNNAAQQVVYVSQNNAPLSQVSLSGASTGAIGTAQPFTATVSPLTATLPVTYIWQASEQPPYSHTVSSYDDERSFTWTLSGAKVVTVTVSGAAGGEQVATRTIVISGGNFSVYLPLVLKE
ncbi:MAG TPA: hypothetical protein G4N96_08085 [Chloroflexi bacterium]|nr:MAG: hypothetical protein B6243_08505 [Anaerolineaceae bacterium 4572_5.2]HEY85050.1 hypothetical protein [Chloroflexota bacterium]